MQPNRLRTIWAEGRPALNGWCSIGNAFTAEIMAAQGFDSVTVDLQHGALDYSALLPMFQAMKASGAVLMARVPWRDPTWVMKALDAGAMGIICPMVNSGAEAAEFVSFLRYPPLGQRSFGPTRANFAHPGYNVKDANREVLALAMIETAQGVEHLEDIAATPGLDGIYVGPADLALGTQAGRLAPGFDREEPEMVEIIQRIAQVCKDNGIIACLHCGTPEYAARAVGWGYRLTTIGGDARILAAGAAAQVAAFRDATGGAAAAGTKGGY